MGAGSGKQVTMEPRTQRELQYERTGGQQIQVAPAIPLSFFFTRLLPIEEPRSEKAVLDFLNRIYSENPSKKWHIAYPHHAIRHSYMEDNIEATIVAINPHDSVVKQAQLWFTVEYLSNANADGNATARGWIFVVTNEALKPDQLTRFRDEAVLSEIIRDYYDITNVIDSYATRNILFKVQWRPLSFRPEINTVFLVDGPDLANTGRLEDIENMIMTNVSRHLLLPDDLVFGFNHKIYNIALLGISATDRGYICYLIEKDEEKELAKMSANPKNTFTSRILCVAASLPTFSTPEINELKHMQRKREEEFLYAMKIYHRTQKAAKLNRDRNSVAGTFTGMEKHRDQ